MTTATVTATATTTNIVVAAYKNATDFAYKIDKNATVLIYDKENPNNPLTIPVNKGNEASAYLKYIIDNYEKLPDYTFFIHDNEFDWHHSGSVIDKYAEAVNSGQKYYNINDKCHWDKPNLIPPHLYATLMQWYNVFVEEYIPIQSVPNNKDFIYGYRGAAQFLVHKDLIRILPKQFYTRIYEWIISTEWPTYVTGRCLEWTWHVFWQIYPELLVQNKI